MAIRMRAGPRRNYAGSDGAREGNLRRLDEPAALALGEWIELLARISHDLRTPLNAVIGFSDAMQNELFGPLGNNRYQEYARHIRDSGDQLLSAAEDTLAMTSLLAAPRTVQLADIRLADLLHDAAAELSDKASAAGLTIEIDVAADIEVRGEDSSLGRALYHLLATALAWSAGQSSVGGALLQVSARAAHGMVDLSLVVEHVEAQGDCAASMPPRQQPDVAPSSVSSETGLGRDDLSLWLARVLLQMQDCPLRVDHGPARFALAVAFEEVSQSDFFARESALVS